MFDDYSNVYYHGDTGWLIVGLVILFGSVGSLFPQMKMIIRKRTSHGLSIVSIVITHLCQTSILMNVLCLRSDQFIGANHCESFIRAIPRLMTVINSVSYFSAYSAVLLLTMIFQPIDHDQSSVMPLKYLAKKHIYIEILIVYILMVPALLLYTGVNYGFFSSEYKFFGKVMGVFSMTIVVVQYLPQMITTYKLRDSGSLSLTMLIMQAPGSIMNCLFLAIGQKENITTWISVLISSIQQFILIIMIMKFRCEKKSDVSQIY